MFLKPSDLESLLQPCSDERPAGCDIRVDRSTFRPLRNQYNAAKTSFRQLLQEPDAEVRDDLHKVTSRSWEGMSGKLIEILTSKTKDLELVSWLCESQLFGQTPWVSLKVSMDLLDQIIELYWQDCHPGAVNNETSDQDTAPDITKRVALLRMLFGEGNDSGVLVLPVRMAPLIGSTTLADLLAAEHKGQSETIKATLISTLNGEEEILRERVILFYGLERQIQEIDKRLLSLCGSVWPAGGIQPFSGLIKTLIRWLDFICSDQISDWPDGLPSGNAQSPQTQPQVDVAQESTAAENGIATTGVEPAAVENAMPEQSQTQPSWTEGYGQVVGHQTEVVSGRVDAYQQLQKLADYFRWAEPHSPVVCLLDRALAWGQMSVTELMQELLKGHQHALERVDDLTGLLAMRAGSASASGRLNFHFVPDDSVNNGLTDRNVVPEAAPSSPSPGGWDNMMENTPHTEQISKPSSTQNTASVENTDSMTDEMSDHQPPELAGTAGDINQQLI
ncbi:type VI secretion system ImpA family N-terminal domain-containing protein [Parendozoicomonas sp. Alg238-R29]|uniref:type VI secretion system protein TssA n=1 Tax=Parendozoicomonas sp. Alg238-R29 TaxID=2993446 RepID=UPI00248D67E9|nr:type VI secretion system ImpA family N-terminal domain-containing protein [Parendozoicomonas sp. Alg238-R29]